MNLGSRLAAFHRVEKSRWRCCVRFLLVSAALEAGSAIVAKSRRHSIFKVS